MRKIAIVGTADGKDEAPVNDPTWEIWACYWRLAADLDRCDRVYELHDALTREPECIPALQPEKLARCIPLMDVTREALGLPKARPAIEVWSFYPDPSWAGGTSEPRTLDAGPLVDRFGEYFTNSVSWMIGHALHEHYEADAMCASRHRESLPLRDVDIAGRIGEIGVFGVNMATTKEYAHERPSVEYMLGWARGAGITVTLPAVSDLLHCGNLYGLDRETWVEHKLLEQRRYAVVALRGLDESQQWTRYGYEEQIAQIDYELRLRFHTREPEVDR